jgi:PIN domain nuclease of toxin-antitoxin system
MPHVKTLKQHTLILDTHVFLWYMQANPILSPTFLKIMEKKENETILVSAITFWEIGMFAEKGKIQFDMDTLDWVERALSCPIFQVVPLSPKIAAQSSRLSDNLHGDPADRILIATAIEYHAVLVTCDEKILSFGGHRTINVHNPK